MLIIFIANAIGLLASVIFSISVQAKSKSKMLLFQSINASLSAVSCLLLGGISGFITNAIATIRNILVAKNIKKKWIYIGILAGLLIAGIAFNSEGLWGFIPIIASFQYAVVLMFTDKYIISKISMLFNCLLWAIYDLYILNIVGAIFSFATLISILISIIRQKKKEA